MHVYSLNTKRKSLIKKGFSSLIEMFENVALLLNFSTVSSEEFVAVDSDDNMSTAPITGDKDILEFVQSSHIIIDADSDDESKTK
ncbi:hypothetical protein TNCV_1072081 [Trichonephila clavipes]|nr:hypothetical protein TNCV_1072081 [Trichonephila clavipes]